jgi:hypothetical protein
MSRRDSFTAGYASDEAPVDDQETAPPLNPPVPTLSHPQQIPAFGGVRFGEELIEGRRRDAAGDPPSAQGPKRSRSGTITAAPEPAGPPRIRPILRDDMEPTAPSIDTESGESLYMPFGDVDGDSLAYPKDLTATMAAFLNICQVKQLKPGNFVMARYFYADREQDSLALNISITRSFQGGSDPDSSFLNHPHAPIRFWIRGASTAKTPTLVNSDKAVYRTISARSAAIVATVRAFWPPALIIGPTQKHSLMWSFSLESKDNERDNLYRLAKALEEEYSGCFFATVRHRALVGGVLSNPTGSSLQKASPNTAFGGCS